MDKYLAYRNNKKFTVIQAHLLGFNVTDKNVYGVRAFENNDFNKPNESYWQHADYIINKAESLGLYMALLPVWARSYIEDKKGAEGENAAGKPLLSSDTHMAYKYGWYLGNMPLKISNKNNVQVFTPPTNEGEKNDWVLILDDASKGFSAPGHFFH